MSPIGRIFVIINLVLSAGFLGFAANNLASAQKYRAQFDSVTDELKAAKDAAADQISVLTKERDDAISARESARDSKEALEITKTGLEQDLADRTAELNKLKADMGNISSSLGDLASQVDDMNGQVEQANNQRVAAVEARRDAENARDAADQARAAAEDRANQLDSTLKQSERDLTTAKAEIQDLETTISTIVAQTGINLDGGAVPPIDGAVLQYYSDLKLVHINRGTNDQVKRGFVFDIFSGGEYKGQARVEVVNPATCTAVVLNTVDGTQIVQGDRVSTQI